MPGSSRQPTFSPHPNPLRDVPMGERLLPSQPPPQVVIHCKTPVPAPDSMDTSQQPPTLSSPVIGQDQHPVLPSQPPHPQPVPRDQQLPPSTSSDDATDFLRVLNPREINSIPRPRCLSQKNLRAEMRLDQTPDAKAYYNKIRNVIRGHMGEWYWASWSSVTDNQKDVLYAKVFSDPRIPIIKRYKDNWATEEVAKTIASGRRTAAYQRGEATPPTKYAYNAANSAKRNKKAPRGRWDSTSESIVRQGKKAQHPQQAQDATPASPVPPYQVTSPSQITDSLVSIPFTHYTDGGSSMYHSFQLPSQSPPSNGMVVHARFQSDQDQRLGWYGNKHSTSAGANATSCEREDASSSRATNQPASPMYHSFQLGSSTSADDPATRPGPRTGQYEQDNYFRGESSPLPSIPPTPRLVPYRPAVEHQQTTPTPVLQQTQRRVQRLPSIMENLYKINAEDETTEDGDDLYGLED